jgi:hypothetical protein
LLPMSWKNTQKNTKNCKDASQDASQNKRLNSTHIRY